MGPSKRHPLDRTRPSRRPIWRWLFYNLRKFPLPPFKTHPPNRIKQLSAILYQLDVYGHELGASALAANGILRFIFCAAFPLFTVQMYEALGIHWAGSLFAFLALAMMPVPWVFFKYGHLLRKRSRYVPVVAADEEESK